MIHIRRKKYENKKSWRGSGTEKKKDAKMSLNQEHIRSAFVK